MLYGDFFCCDTTSDHRAGNEARLSSDVNFTHENYDHAEDETLTSSKHSFDNKTCDEMFVHTLKQLRISFQQLLV